jgi:PhnB protein
MKIPEQYLPVMPYLIIRGAAKLVAFMKAVFDAKEQMIVPDDAGKIMHGEMRIHDAVIMLGDASDTWKEKTAAMYLYVDDVDKVYAKAMKNNAKSLEAPSRKDYGYTAGIEDPFGNHWFIVQP